MMMIRWWLPLSSLFFFPTTNAQQRIAVIGGGISGTFVAKYLVDYDIDCSLDALTVFDPLPLGQVLTKTTNNDALWQGSRVGTYQMDDGRIIELGASIIIDRFQSILDMAHSGNLTIGKPFQTGHLDDNMRAGMVIYNGNQDIALNTANTTDFWKKFSLFWRYNIDLLKISRATTDAIDRFQTLQDNLKNDGDSTFYTSPEDMWDSVHLKSLKDTSLEEFCDSAGVPQGIPWWRRYFLYGQGSLREELLPSINLVNYNQDNAEINALAGLASFSVASVKSYGIIGGNVQVVHSAFDQAKTKQQTECHPKPKDVVTHSHQRVSTVVGSLQGFELYAEDGSVIGDYDIVILAAPLSMARVEFLVKSHIDESVLQPMPLGGLVLNQDHDENSSSSSSSKISDDHEGHLPLPSKLPQGVTRTYTQVVTTIVRNAELQLDYFGIDPEHVPRGIYMTPKGKAAEYNVTSIAQIASDGIYKVFSSQPLTQETLQLFFGPSVQVEYEKIWGGKYGGATPQYKGRGETTGFLLYDGATGFHGHTKSGALYYPNALELTFACIELSAMGAKAVAKLIAKRLEWITPSKPDYGMGDEF